MVIRNTATKEEHAVITVPNAAKQEISAAKARMTVNQGAATRATILTPFLRERDVSQLEPRYVLMERAIAQVNLILVKMDIVFTIVDDGIFVILENS